MVKVGLLEDNTRIATLCAKMLCSAGYEVSIYEHPQECLRALQPLFRPLSTDEDYSALKSIPIDVLILDLHLPDMTGAEILHLLCSRPPKQSIPLILCSAATPSEVSNAMRLAPRADFLEKPFSYRSLVSAIENALQVQKA